MSVIPLDGLSADNPFAFMAALGTLVTADVARPAQERDPPARLHWERQAGAWRPRLTTSWDCDRESLVEALHSVVHRVPPAAGAEELRQADTALRKAKAEFKNAEKEFKGRLKAREFKRASDAAKRAWDESVEPHRVKFDAAEEARRQAAGAGGVPDPSTAVGPCLKVKPSVLRDFQLAAANAAAGRARRLADLAVAFGCDLVTGPDGLVAPTRFSKQNGNSGKNMLLDIATLMQSVTTEQIARSLFLRWDYRDQGRSLGWDPRDVRPYALQAADPAAGSWTMHGANVLAYEALVLFPAVPRGKGLATTGTERICGQDAFTWPVWDRPLTADVIRSALALPHLQTDSPDRTVLAAMGIVAVFRADHYTEGKSQRFRPARAV